MEGLKTKNADITTNCLRTYAAIDRIAEAEAMFRNHIAAPFLEKVCSLFLFFSRLSYLLCFLFSIFSIFSPADHNLKIITVQKLEKGKRGSTEGLEDIYSGIITWMDKECRYDLFFFSFPRFPCFARLRLFRTKHHPIADSS
jgi:hypothetical protein